MDPELVSAKATNRLETRRRCAHPDLVLDNFRGQGQFDATTPRWTATVFAGLSIALAGSPSSL